MTIDTTFPPAKPRSARPSRSRKAPARWGRRRRLLIPRRRNGRVSVPLADLALHDLMQDADIYKIGRTHYLVAPVRAGLLDDLIAAAGSAEDDEENGDLESSLGGRDDDLEGDGLEDMFGGFLISKESDGNCDDELDHDNEPDHDGETLDGDGSTPWSAAV